MMTSEEKMIDIRKQMIDVTSQIGIQILKAVVNQFTTEVKCAEIDITNVVPQCMLL